MIAACLLALATQPDRLIVVRVENARVEVALMPAAGGSARVLHSHPLTVVRGTSIDDENHNESLMRSLACAVSAARDSVATLEVVSSIPGAPPHRPNNWISSVILTTVDLAGRVIRRDSTRVSAGGELFVGFDNDDRAMLIFIGEEGYRTFVHGEWRSVQKADLPPSFRSLFVNSALPNDALTLGRRLDPRFDRNGEIEVASPTWTNASFPTFDNQGTSVKTARSVSGDATIASGFKAIAGKWGARNPLLAIKGRALEFAFPLAYPWVVGRINRRRKLMTQYQGLPIVPMDPFIDSTLWRINVVTGKRIRLGEGIYALPL
jgi:hypothetical protein